MARKVKTSIALDEELIIWIDEMIKKKRFANRSHAIEYSIVTMRERIEKKCI